MKTFVLVLLSLIFAPSLSGQDTGFKTFILSLESDDISRDYAGYFRENRSNLDVTGITVLRAMREKSTLSQRSLLPVLKRFQDKGEISSYKPLWLIDAVVVTTTDSIINILSKNNIISEIYSDYNLFNRNIEPLPVDTSLFHLLQAQVGNMKLSSEKSKFKSGEGRRISFIGGNLPTYYPYSPDNIEVIQIDESLINDENTANWDWLTVSAFGWRDSWDNMGIAYKSMIKYVPLFNHASGTPLSDILLALDKLMNINDNTKKPDIIAMTWDLKFGEELEPLWNVIRAIEASQTAFLMMYPENSSAIVRDLPGLFIQGYSEYSKAPYDVVKAPQLLHTSDGSVYFSDLVSLGYVAATLSLLRNDNEKALLNKRYDALKYVSTGTNYPDYNINVASSALNMGTAEVHGIVTLAGTRSPEPLISVEIRTESETKTVETDEMGRYSAIVISENAVIKIDEIKFYSDSLIVNLQGKNSYEGNFSLVPKKRVDVSGKLINSSGSPVGGKVHYFMEGELFTTATSTDDGIYNVELVPGRFDLKVYPEFPYAIAEMIQRVTVDAGTFQPISVSIADVGIISLDNDDKLLPFYASALDSLELTYSFHQWDKDRDKKYFFELLGYKTVIIYSGDVTPFVSVTSLLKELDEFLRNGGHVIYTGQKILEFMDEYEPFKSDGLKFAGNRNELLLYNSTVSGMPIYTSISGVIGADNQLDPDAIDFAENSLPFIFYDSKEKTAGGVIVNKELEGSYALLGFGLESVYKPYGSSSFASSSQIFDYIFKILWGNADKKIKVKRYEFPNSENISSIRLIKSTPVPFTSESRIKFYIPQPAQVKMELYSTDGNLVATILNDSRDMGGYEVNWIPLKSNIDLSPGIYILILRVQGNTGLAHTLMSKMLHL
ncbi:MAG: carboxypeptidase regulatory-like domain-containing protein [Candidatus Marinimicrobia bacterium]|nr:carboxypeptidase regulatory-like domain-containing protein [Candidatus Neomarinimicrobiota bacterium]